MIVSLNVNFNKAMNPTQLYVLLIAVLLHSATLQAKQQKQQQLQQQPHNHYSTTMYM